MLMLMSFFYSRAQINDASVRLHFAFDNAQLSNSYMDNAAAMEKFNSLVASLADGSSISVITYSSPEGNVAYNQDLSRRRAESVRNYIVANYPALEGRIKIVACAESWDELRLSVAGDTRLSAYARESILNIIDSNADADSKENALKANSAYKSLYANYFRGLRYANIALRIKNLSESTPHYTTSQFSANKNSEAEGEPVVYYSLSEDFIRPGFMNNSANLRVIRNILSNPANRQRTITIEGAASPEGPVSINTRLGIVRAENLANWIIGQFPDMEGKVIVRSKGEDWEGLYNSVENCESIDATAKQELLDIIGSNDEPAAKEARLKAHPAYSTVESDCLPYIRYARISGLTFTEASEETSEPVQQEDANAHADEQETPEREQVTEPADTTEVLPAKDTTSAVVPVENMGNVDGAKDGDLAGNAGKFTRVRNTIVAAKTNLLYDAVTALNVEVEIPIWDRLSIMWEDTFPWWETGNKYCFQLWEMGAEARYWFKPWNTVGTEKLRGFFAGPYVMSGKYDFQFDKAINYQGELWSAGITAGYSAPIGKSKKVNLEFSLSMGYMKSPFRHYQPTDDYSKLIKDPANNGTFYNIFMYPTKAKVSLVVPISVPTSKREVSYE